MFFLYILIFCFYCFFFFFNDTATTEIYTLSLHDALPILLLAQLAGPRGQCLWRSPAGRSRQKQDRKSTRLNSSHLVISYAVFCLKKKKKQNYRYLFKEKKKKNKK